jgi:protein-S-isoprenylcysteine O-methyltransferase Ste14
MAAEPMTPTNPIRERILNMLMQLIYVAAALVVPTAVILGVLAEPFRGRNTMVLLFVVICLERIWAMMFRMPRRNKTQAKGDWTACAVGLSNALVQYAILVEFLWFRRDGLNLAVLVAGLLLYLTGLTLRHGALHHLAEQWTVQLDEKVEGKHLIRSGPYGWIRHPIYTAACTEMIGVCLLFSAPLSLLGALFLFIPAEYKRARFEEQFLREDFGSAYDAYATEVPGFLPRPRRRNK